MIAWGRGARSNSRSATSERPAGWLDYLSLGTAILIIEAIFLFFFATAPEKLEELATSFDEKLHPESYLGQSPSGPGDQRSVNATTSGNWLWQNNGQRTLGTRGRVRPSNRPEVFLWPSKGKKFNTLRDDIYLRSFTLSRYNSGTWKARPIPTVGLEAENEIIRLLPRNEDDLNYEIAHEPNTSGQSLLVSIPDVTAVSLPTLRLIAPDTYRLPLLAEGKKLHRYQSASRPAFFNSASDEPAPAESGELDIPENLREQLALLTSNFTGTKPLQLAHIRSLLGERCQYSLETDFESDVEIISQFLFTKRRGYCEHFATAAALLARTIGYPSRVAYGWSGGRYYNSPNMYVFRAKEAHAWTEVKVAGKGWVIFDATPTNRAEGNSSLADNSESPPFPAGLPLSDLNLPDFLQGADSTEGGSVHFGMSPLTLLKFISVILAIGGLITLIALLLVKRKKKDVSKGGPGSRLLPPAASYLTAFQKACAALGNPMPVGRTLRDHLATLDRANFSEELLRYHYGLHYAGKPRDKSRERRLLKEIKLWGAS